ncbi:glycosyltransferase family 39 protein [Curtobacterium flaccumfaciens]|nr:glycosyltransferase family 39 protein [Curtobacterium flaccumfaciens]
MSHAHLAERRLLLPARRLVQQPVVRIAALVVVFVWGVYQSLWKIGATNAQVDEGLYAKSGWEYLHGIETSNLEHPPVAKYLFGFAQVVLGHEFEHARIVSGVAVVLGAAVTFLWFRNELGWWTATFAAAMWMLLPRGTYDDQNRIDRYALLDPVMVFFMIAAMACAWRWIRAEKWWWIAAAGALMGLSVTSKVSTAWVLPAFLILPVLWRRWKQLAIGGGIFVAAFTVVFVLVYLPVGLVHGVSYMLRFQSEHDADGHIVLVAGQRYQFPPWWAGLWFALQGVGKLVAVSLVVSVFAAIVNRPNRLVVFLVVGAAGLLVFYLGISNVALPNYYYPWLWFAVALAAIGVRGLVLERWFGTAVGIIVIAIVILVSVRLSVTTWHFERAGIGRVPGYLAGLGRDGDVLTSDVNTAVLNPYFGGHGRIDGRGPFDAIVVGRPDGVPTDKDLAAALAGAQGRLRVVHIDDVTIYLPPATVTLHGTTLKVTGT